MKVLLIRHGQTDWNKKKLIQGWSDIQLNEEGVSEVKEFSKSIKRDYWDYVISSDLSRARHTADIISKTLSIPLIITDRLRERNYGLYEGLDIKCLLNKQTRLNFKSELLEGESYKIFYKRVNLSWNILYEKYGDEKIIVVTHKGVLQIICNIIGITKKWDNLSFLEVDFQNIL
jgi:probable phosphoglycerate mutase